MRGQTKIARFFSTFAVFFLLVAFVVTCCMMPIGAYTFATYFTLRSGGQALITFIFDSCFMWIFSVPIALLLSRFTGISILPLYIICNSLCKSCALWALCRFKDAC